MRFSKVTYILTLVIYAGLYGFTAVMVPIGIAASYAAPRPLFSFIVKCWARGIFVLMGKRLYITGQQRVPRRGFLIVTNHASLFDIPAIMAVFPDVAWLGREYLLQVPLFGHLLKRMNYVGIGKDTTASVRKILRQAVVGTTRFNMAVFPEGTRTLDGSLGKFKRGFVHILRAAELDLLPVRLNGMLELKPKNRFTIYPWVRLEVQIEHPLPFEELKSMKNEEILDKVRTIFQNHLDGRIKSVKSEENNRHDQWEMGHYH